MKKLASKSKVADPNKPLSNTKNWYSDRYQTVLVQRNILAGVTFVALIATLISSYSVAQLTPLKSVQPFVIQVDEKTGITKVVDPLQDKEISTNQALIEFFLTRYIQAREGYNELAYKENYAAVRVMTNKEIFGDYQRYISPENKESPVNVFGRHSQRIVDFVSLSMVNEKTAQVRVVIKAEGKLQELGTFKDQAKVIWVTFEFAKLSLTSKERQLNPLGFQVKSYSVDDEILGAK